MIIKCLIADDELIARNIIKDYLEEDPLFEVMAECGSGPETVKSILEKKPDLVFLDIQMPVMDGFEVIQTIGLKKLPFIIFITAYDQYAIKAFEINALDYLLKPFDDERFKAALDRAKKYIISNDNLRNQIFNLVEEVKGRQKYMNKILIKDGGRIFLLRSEEIKWIESASNYLKIFSNNEYFLHRETMGSFEKKLNPDNFVRIHRSYIVNVNYIKEFHPWDKYNYKVILNDGKVLKLSCKYRERLFEILNMPEN